MSRRVVEFQISDLLLRFEIRERQRRRIKMSGSSLYKFTLAQNI